MSNNTKSERIAITGLGLVSSLGHTAASSVSAIMSRITNFREHETVLVGNTELRGASIARAYGPQLPASLTGDDRALALLLPAIRECTFGLAPEALTKAHWRIDSMTSPASNDFWGRLKNELPELKIEKGSGAQQSVGRCSFFENIIAATTLLQQGKTRMAVVGCVDSLCEISSLEKLNEAGRLKSGSNPDGIIPGEAAGVILLEKESHAKKRNTPILAYITSWGRGIEPNPWTGTKPSKAKGLLDAFQETLKQLPAKGAEIQLVVADLNGERARSYEWGIANGMAFPRNNGARKLMHPADCTGDCGTAMGAVLLGAAVGAVSDPASAKRVAICTSDDAGARCVLCLEEAEYPERGRIALQEYGVKNKVFVHPGLLDQQHDDAAFAWLLREQYVTAPHITLQDLAKHDNRINSNLNGLRIAGAQGWDLCAKALKEGSAGECFVAAVLAFESNDESRIQTVLDKGSGVYKLSRGIVSALGWLPYEKAEPHIRTFLSSQFPEYRRIGIAASAIHRVDPGDALLNALSDNDPLLLARALKAAGELGNTKLLPSVQANLSHTDEGCRFWAAWSLAMLGNASSLPILKTLAVSSKQYREEAVKASLRRMSPKDALVWQGELALRPETMRQAVIGSGVIGNHTMIPWVIEQMKSPALSRIAGEAFSMITGIDIALEHLDAKKPEGFESGPNDDPKDSNVEMDADDDLPWPNAEAIQAWWEKQKGAYKNGTRYFMGKPIAKEHLQNVLKFGYQHQRRAAAMELAFLNPGQPLFETRAPGWRQK